MIIIPYIGKALAPAFAEMVRKAPLATKGEWELAAGVAVAGAITLIAIDAWAARREKEKGLTQVRRN